jgi:hypothetical protein
MTQAQEARWKMHSKVTCSQGRALYRRRKVIAEPVFGPIKQALGFFSLRGLAKVASEWGIVCLCHNVLKLYRAVAARPAFAIRSQWAQTRPRMAPKTLARSHRAK